MHRTETALAVGLGLVLGLLTPAWAATEEVVLLGPLLRAQIEDAVPAWVEAEIRANPDLHAAMGLEEALQGADVTIYLGTWCSDSQREMARLWRAMDESGLVEPAEIRYVGVDRRKRKPKALLSGIDLRYVPTIVVQRDGVEVGRIVEISPGGVEHDLLALLKGEAKGLVTGRADLLPQAGADESR